MKLSKNKIFYYVENFSENPSFSKNFNKDVKTKYIYRGIALIFLIPIDLILFLNNFLWPKKKASWILLNTINPNLEILMRNEGIVFIGTPINFLKIIRQKYYYIPASFIYPFLLISLLSQKKTRNLFLMLCLTITTNLFKLFSGNRAKVICSSDALPFNRVLLLAAQNLNLRKILIQHGDYSKYLKLKEIDGLYSDKIICRSNFNRKIIMQSDSKIKFLIEKNYFSKNISNNSQKNIVLVGEGWRRLDPNFSEKYHKKLKVIEKYLLKSQFKIVFRPHPSERFIGMFYGFRNIEFCSIEKSMSRSLCYIGYSSSLLNEASSSNILAAQISVENKFFNGVNLHGNKIHKIEDFSDLNFLLKIHKLDTHSNFKNYTNYKKIFMKLKAS